MDRSKLAAGCLVLVLAFPGAGLTDPWKDESGHGRGNQRAERWDRDGRDWRDRRERRSENYHRPYAQPRIPPGHLPPPGESRMWLPDLPPGHQPPPQPWR